MYKNIEINSDIKNKLKQYLPTTLVKEREGGGGKKLKYFPGSVITDTLNEAFGYAWSTQILRLWIEESQPFFNQYSKVPDEEKVSYNGKKGAWENQAPVAHAHIKLLVPFKDESGNIIWISKEATGSKSILGKQNDQESIFKAACTDGLKKAASLFGIGLQLYRSEEETIYFNELNYVDPWTDEMKEKYKEELDFISNYLTEYGVSQEEFYIYIQNVYETSEINPDNITYIVADIKKQLAGAQ